MAGAVTDMPVLYSFRRCPFAMRARMALIVSGVVWEHREISLHDKPAAMLAASPKGTVPVLILPDGSVIDESLDIMLWALDRSDPERWMARFDPPLVATFDSAFKHHLDRYKYAARYGEDPLVHRAAGLAMLFRLGQQFGGADFVGGASRGFGDVAIFPFVRQFAGVDPAWFDANAPHDVKRWLKSLVASDLFDRAMTRFAPWSAEREARGEDGLSPR